ncbi:hypothetical protein [Raoultella terrigena]|uniref:hypothetical protein n=1 Tax=Raoultella terrigena TaxID=577 RepID=UPI00384B4210
MKRLKKAINDHRFSKMCAALAAMVSVGGAAGGGSLLMALGLGFAIVITHIR